MAGKDFERIAFLHAPDATLVLADRVILLNAGRAVASGTVGELTADGNLEQLFLSLTTPGGAA